MKKVSAIITTYNRLELLKRAIKSVKSQTYDNIELIVVCDGSEDGTKEYCESLNDIIFVYIPKEDSKGGNHARNVGIEHSTGYYVAFLDDDDYWLPTKIEHQVRGIEEHPDCKFSICPFFHENPDKEDALRLAEGQSKPSFITAQVEDHSIKSLIWIYTITSAFFIEKELLVELGMFDESLKAWQDRDLLIRITQETKVYSINTPLLVYRNNGNTKNAISSKYDLFTKSKHIVNNKHKTLLRKLNISQKLTKKQFEYGVQKHIALNSGMRYTALNCRIRFFTYRMILKFINYPKIRLFHI